MPAARLTSLAIAAQWVKPERLQHAARALATRHSHIKLTTIHRAHFGVAGCRNSVVSVVITGRWSNAFMISLVVSRDGTSQRFPYSGNLRPAQMACHAKRETAPTDGATDDSERNLAERYLEYSGQ
jgi:hypothetical protein